MKGVAATVAPFVVSVKKTRPYNNKLFLTLSKRFINKINQI